MLSALLGGFLLGGALAHGQTDRATITGTVSDQTGAVLPGAAVTATETSTGAVFSSVTNANGVYSISSLPVGSYTLAIRREGFTEYLRSGILPVAGQVVVVDARMSVGSTSEIVKVTSSPIEDTETSSEMATIEDTAIRELPENASGGRDATNLLIQSSPNVYSAGTWGVGMNFISISGGLGYSNSVAVDGVSAANQMQGNINTPGQDAIQEMQLQTDVTDVELAGTGGGALTYVLKSGTNKFHGSAFEFLQNEDLNANSYANKQFLSQCAAGDSACAATYARPYYRFNDFGGSAGGPIWKNHTFVFGDYEYYKQTNLEQIPNGTQVPTAQMLTGDFSQLLTEGTFTGDVTTTPGQSGGTPVINPCTGQPYQYGEIFDPATTQTINGVVCATPFAGNIIPSGRISQLSNNVAAIYAKYYQPTRNSITSGNFPALASSEPEQLKKSFDVKVDQYFSQKHHLSASVDLVSQDLTLIFGSFLWDQGPFSGAYDFANYPNIMSRIVDNYTFSPTLINTLSFGYGMQPSVQAPKAKINTSQYGFNEGSTTFPDLVFQDTNGANFTPLYNTNWDLYEVWNAFDYSDTVVWQKGRHSLKFGGQWHDQQLNAGVYTQHEMQFNFNSNEGGPSDPLATPFVGSGFANMMLGDVNSANLAEANIQDPRQKSFALFAQDDFKVNPNLTLNLGLRWDVTLPGHMANGTWENFDTTVTNPNWAPYAGAWVFSKNSGTTFETETPLHQFGPHIGGAYKLTPKLVARASYGLFYIPLGAFSSNAGDTWPANQNPLDYGINQVLSPGNSVTGIAFNWDNQYPGQTVLPPQNSTATAFGDEGWLMYIEPNMLKLGHTQNMYAGIQYEVARNVLLDVRYVGNRGGGMHDYGHSTDQSWPSWGQYQPLLAAGTINSQINDASDAAALGVPYPYPGFSGPAYAAIAPYPQAAARYITVMNVGADPQWNAVSAYNSFVAELKVRNTHGLYVEWTYTCSKQTSDQRNHSNQATNFNSMYQSPTDDLGAASTVVGWDQRNLAKGYVTYDLPFGAKGIWLREPRLLDYAVGGWTLGFIGSYGSGTPLGSVYSLLQLPYFYTGGQRAFYGSGFNGNNIKNSFHGHLDLINPTDPSNQDFNTNAFVSGSVAAPFGNTPLEFNHWRWNPGAANESMSLVKHFGFGPDGRFQASLRGEFYDIFNRHYYNSPDIGLADYTYGMVTGASGYRTGQVGARFEW